MSLFNELKRRNVFKVGIAYAVVAWLIMQVADVMIDNIGAPDWVFRSIVLVLGLGFPLVLIFAWAFEMTPEGIKLEKDVDRSQSITPQTGQKLNYAIMAIMALALAYFAWDKFSAPEAEQVATTGDEQAIDKSIAVLPFVNMSADENNEYFSDGLSEELLNMLAKVDGLKVAARTSSFKFKESEEDIAEIGQKLNVATILEGSVRKAGNQARITAQLIKVDDGFHLWSETYDRDLSNIFEVQDEIARAIVDALKLPLLGENAAPIAANAAASFEAYDLYLLGRHHYWQVNAEGYERAVDYFGRAVAIDPEFAPAWSGLAEAYLSLSDYGDRPIEETHPLAKKAIDKASQLAPDAPETLVARANLISYQGLFQEATPLLERALAKNPNNINALLQLAAYLPPAELERSVELANKAYELDPLSEMTRNMLIQFTANDGDFDGALRLAREMLLDDPNNPGLYEALANVHELAGNLHLAIPAWEMTWELRPGDVLPGTAIARIYRFLEDTKSADVWLEKARQRGPETRWVTIAELIQNFDQQEFETLADRYGKMMQDGTIQPVRELFYGDTMIRLGRPEQAEQLYRGVIERFGDSGTVIKTNLHANATERLLTLLPEGQERQQRLSLLRDFIEKLAQDQPWSGGSWRERADLAMLEGDTPAAMEHLTKAIDLGFQWRNALEYSVLYMGISEDPAFRAVLAKASDKARVQRELLEAEQTAMETGG
ncbi:MAG: tetratricopeptide repeat protein [Xanthomonadales bacterium]|nr:tetratricopeptide repeat protein [Xanthomonadales bacterium]